MGPVTAANKPCCSWVPVPSAGSVTALPHQPSLRHSVPGPQASIYCVLLSLETRCQAAASCFYGAKQAQNAMGPHVWVAVPAWGLPPLLDVGRSTGCIGPMCPCSGSAMGNTGPYQVPTARHMCLNGHLQCSAGRALGLVVAGLLPSTSERGSGCRTLAAPAGEAPQAGFPELCLLAVGVRAPACGSGDCWHGPGAGGAG